MKTFSEKDEKPNLVTVARKAGVSPATVSRALNNPSKVDPSTLQRIQKVIKEINYQPNRVAQRLRIKDGQKKIIGLLVPDIQNPFYVDVMRGVEEFAYANKYAIIASNFAQNKDKEKLYLNILKSEGIDGLIVAPYDEHDQEVIELIKGGMPVVCVDRGLADFDVDVVCVDNEKGAFEAVDFLIQKGHERIGYIGGLSSIPTTHQRKNGYIKALLKHGAPIDESLIRFGDSTNNSGKQIANEMIFMENPPTAVFTGNNLITLGALEAIHSAGYSVPRDFAIIGFDDMPWSISLNPPLTAVRQPGFEIGRRAVDMLFSRIKDPERMCAKITLKTELIVRSSC